MNHAHGITAATVTPGEICYKVVLFRGEQPLLEIGLFPQTTDRLDTWVDPIINSPRFKETPSSRAGDVAINYHNVVSMTVRDGSRRSGLIVEILHLTDYGTMTETKWGIDFVD